MKKMVLMTLAMLCSFVWGDDVVALPEPVDATSVISEEAARNAERERLTRARQQLDAQYREDMKACYQYFDVTSCRLKARDRRIEANAVLRKEEIEFNAQERRRHAQEAQRALAEKNSEAQQKQSQAERAAAIAASKERADANAQKQIDHALQGTKRGDYEQKQREAAQHREDVARKIRERNKEPAAPLPVPSK
jgi:hypothetical protein